MVDVIQKFVHTMFTTVCVLGLVMSSAASATWYESTGQAIIENNNKALARQQATHNAIKQALLFAGASVKSVQQLTNGLLMEEQLEIRSTSEVNQLQLVSEHYDGDIATIIVRADIFPQPINCQQADYTKPILMSWFPLKHRHHANTGELFNFAEDISGQLANEIDASGKNLALKSVELGNIQKDLSSVELLYLGRKHHAQFLLTGSINSIAVHPTQTSWLNWSSNEVTERDFSINYQVVDLTDGSTVLQSKEAIHAAYEFDLHQPIDTSSDYFWQSTYGKAVHSRLVNMVTEVNESLACQPTHGRIIEIEQDKLVIDLGRQQGVKVGDQLTLFQVLQRKDLSNTSHYRYSIYPQQTEVKEVFANTAILVDIQGIPFNNIQLNDYAVRR